MTKYIMAWACSQLLELVSSGPVIAMELMGESAIAKWREVIGPTDCAVARSQAPLSIRARFGTGTHTLAYYQLIAEDM